MSDHEGSVYLIDDDAGVRDALCLLLSLKGIRTQVFASGESFIEAYRPDWLGCILSDLRMPGMSGLELQAVLKQRQIPLPLVILTGHGDVAAVRTALKNGALDFLEKPFEEELLLEVLNNAFRVERERRIGEHERAAASDRLANLTAREREILTPIVEGKQNVQIAAQFGISPRTVEVHKARIMEKLGCRSLAELIRKIS
ncbi:MAG: two component transcriptional regulator, LuxR family [Gammaproteobacteria bacterium]|nr:two component transcriptional regulator, LuxR family [Gammaproteobacteria bacterium]